MVERKRTVIGAGAADRCKQREDTSRELIDLGALCDEHVARGEPSRRGLNWSDSQVFFHAGTNRARDRSQHRDIPVAVDHIEILVAPLGREHFIGHSGHAYGSAAGESGKGHWSGGI